MRKEGFRHDARATVSRFASCLSRRNRRIRSTPEIASSILAAIGRTPLIRLNRLARELTAQVFVKLEALNPGGSIKDRVGVAMVLEAERQGLAAAGRNDH